MMATLRTTVWLMRLLAGVSLGLAAIAGAREDQRPLVNQADGWAKDKKSPFSKEFAELARAKLEEWKVPGLAMAVVDGEDIFAEGFGMATLPDTPATPETLWYGASTSKAQLAAALAHLVDTEAYGQLSQGWQTPIASIIRDDFVLQDEWATNHVTLEDAVSHRTGMPRHDSSSAREIDGRPVTIKQIVRNLRNLPMTAEPRVKWQYCNLMFTTLSHVVETITGRWLGDVLRETIWGPLGMNATYFGLRAAMDAPEHFAQGYAWLEDAKRYRALPYLDTAEISGAGAVISNALDYAKWVKCLLHEDAPFSKSTHRKIRTPLSVMSALPEAGVDTVLYGLGWMRTTYEGHVLYKHSGGMHAYGAEVYWLPQLKYGVVAFANTASSSNAVEEILAYELIGNRLSLPSEERYNFTAWWRDARDQARERLQDPASNLFPDAPEEPLPPTLNASHLVGKYDNAGYHSFMLREATCQGRHGMKMLVADRHDMTFKYTWTFEHISGDYWVCHVAMLDNPELRDALAAEFRIGPDGQVSGLAVDMRSSGDLTSEGLIVFEKVE